MIQAGIHVSSRKDPKQARSTQLVEDVLEAALQVLKREGPRRFNTARVAEVAGVSVGSLYQYFPNKASILLRLQADEWQRTVARLLDILDDDNLGISERLRLAVAVFVRSEFEEAPIRYALANAAPLLGEAPEAASFRRAAFRQLLRFWRKALPHSTPNDRLRALEIMMVSTEAVGKWVSEGKRTVAEVDASAQRLGDMLCAYLQSISELAS